VEGLGVVVDEGLRAGVNAQHRDGEGAGDGAEVDDGAALSGGGLGRSWGGGDLSRKMGMKRFDMSMVAVMLMLMSLSEKLLSTSAVSTG
jgi:hypothetical protein